MAESSSGTPVSLTQNLHAHTDTSCHKEKAVLSTTVNDPSRLYHWLHVIVYNDLRRLAAGACPRTQSLNVERLFRHRNSHLLQHINAGDTVQGQPDIIQLSESSIFFISYTWFGRWPGICAK